MTDSAEKAAGKPNASETAVPAWMMKTMEREGCRCAEMMPMSTAMCAGTDQDGDVEDPPATKATWSGEEGDP